MGAPIYQPLFQNFFLPLIPFRNWGLFRPNSPPPVYCSLLCSKSSDSEIGYRDNRAELLSNDRVVKEAVTMLGSREMAVDSGADVGYDKGNTIGGVEYEQGLQSDD